jgi:hypothetical protein
MVPVRLLQMFGSSEEASRRTTALMGIKYISVGVGRLNTEPAHRHLYETS